ncbi:MAG: 50S ribosomal protein L11 methyltransferase [Gemmatimonadaceae bacterium]
MTLLAVRVRPGVDRAAVIGALVGAGSPAVQEDGDDLVAYFPGHGDRERMRAAILAASPRADVSIEDTPDVDWSSRWKDAMRARSIGALTFAPPWLTSAAVPAERPTAARRNRTISMDPGMAFGTGEHASTRGAVRLMQRVLRPGDRVADLGCGSGILAIAAARLGAGWVVAIDLDADAIPNAEANVSCNGVEETVTILQGDAFVLLPLIAPVCVVLANIISGVLTANLPVIRDALAPDGRAILAGIMLDERDEMLAVIESAGCKAADEDSEEGWWSVVIARGS